MKSAKIRVILLASLILVGCVILSLVASTLSPVIIPCTGRIGQGIISPLHVEGRHIKDQDNNTVYLRGVFKAEFCDTCTGWFPREEQPTYDGYNYFHEDGVRGMCQELRDVWGANVIHTYTWAKWWIDDAKRTISSTQPGTDHPLRHCLRRFVEIAEECGIYVSFRFYGVQPMIEGGDDRVAMPYPELPEYPSSHFLGSHDGSVIPHRDDFVALWGNIASEFADLPNVIFYLYDEPICWSSEWCETVGMCVNAIRAAEDASGYGIKHIVMAMLGFCGPIHWINDYITANQADPTSYPLDNVTFSSHIYRYHGTYNPCPAGVDCGGPTDYESQKSILEGLGYTPSIIDNVPLAVSAMGTWNGDTDYDEYTSFVNSLRILNEWGLGYAAYQWLRTGLAWRIQQFTGIAVQPPNRVGQALIDAIETGKT